MNSYTQIPICRSSSRRSKPSEFANSIKQFKQTVAKSTKKIKNQNEVSQENIHSSQDVQKSGLYCLMNDGSRIKLQVVFSKTKPISKMTKIKIKEKSSPEPKPVAQKKVSGNDQNNFLFKILNAFQQIQGQNFNIEKPAQSCQEICSNLPSKRELKQYKRKQKDQQDKCEKLYQKIKKLDQKFMEIQETLVYL